MVSEEGGEEGPVGGQTYTKDEVKRLMEIH